MAESLPDWQKSFLSRNRLPEDYLSHALKWFGPLATALVEHQNSAARTLLVAVNGSQGSGKSTLCDYLCSLLQADYGLASASLSLDDFYLTARERRHIALYIHPLLATRGAPGTHDMGLLSATLDALLGGKSASIPRVDKSIDDRVPGSEWEQVISPVQVVFLEGWCMGAMAQPVDELAEPVNALEVREDSDGRWRNYVNNSLAEDFSQLYRRVDRWVMLQAPSFDCVYQWRLEQEQKLALTRSGNAIMSAAEIAHFIQFYQRLTEHCLARLPAWVDHLYRLDKQRRIQSYTSAAEANV